MVRIVTGIIEQNIRGGTKYLAWLSSHFRGDPRVVVAAYLIGEARVLLKGLAYTSPEVFSYVRQVATFYRQKK
jgi:soluble lytic murein transglycosylase-like protein